MAFKTIIHDDQLELETVGLSNQDGHLVFPSFVDMSLTVYVNQATQEIVIDSPTAMVGGREKAGIVCLVLTQAAAHNFVRIFREIESILDEPNVTAKKPSVQ